jgi:selT/selW/selH-like putative selenoprotein
LQAAGLAGFLKEKGFADVVLIKSGGGAFEVEADGRLLFSKKILGRFPDNDEILDNLMKIGRE